VDIFDVVNDASMRNARVRKHAWPVRYGTECSSRMRTKVGKLLSYTMMKSCIVNNSRYKYVHVFTDGAGRRGSGLNLLKGFDGRMEAKIMRDKLLIRGRVCCCACRFQHLLRE